MTAPPVLQMQGITKTYQGSAPLMERLVTRRVPAALKALDGIDLDLRAGEIVALVGESGSGKSTLAKVLVGSTEPTTGTLTYRDKTLPGRRDKDLSRRIQMVFQDPYSSLNPRMTVRAILSELLLVHQVVPRSEVEQECLRLLRLVGLDESALDAYPSQFSGGQRQRIAIARAIAPRPDVLIADEPVSALDVSVQATILDLFRTLRDELDLTILFIAHNLAVVQHLCQRVAVMYLGRLVEVAPTEEIFANPQHPYTRGLIASIPRMHPTSVNSVAVLEGEPPSPYSVPAGCRFNPRCSWATDECRQQDPALLPLAEGEHLSACLHAGDLGEPTQMYGSTPAGKVSLPSLDTLEEEA